jgi:hypothetical protein
LSLTPTVCLAYLCGQDQDFLARSLAVMEPYVWIEHIITLHTEGSKPPQRQGKQQHLYEEFGSGFERQPEDGGFHEINARNRLLELAAASGCQWVLLCDPDEFFLPATFGELRQAHHCGKGAVWFSCYHFRDPQRYLWWPTLVRKVAGSVQPLHDPHPRALRLDLEWQYSPHPSEDTLSRFRNRTQHCRVLPSPAHLSHHAYDLLHVHTRHMFHPKRPPEAALDARENRAAGVELPDVILQHWRRQQTTDSINVGGIAKS